jgi:hypothetical protein
VTCFCARVRQRMVAGVAPRGIPRIRYHFGHLPTCCPDTVPPHQNTAFIMRTSYVIAASPLNLRTTFPAGCLSPSDSKGGVDDRAAGPFTALHDHTWGAISGDETTRRRQAMLSPHVSPQSQLGARQVQCHVWLGLDNEIIFFRAWRARPSETGTAASISTPH